jgi:hypothetical protein
MTSPGDPPERGTLEARARRSTRSARPGLKRAIHRAFLVIRWHPSRRHDRSRPEPGPHACCSAGSSPNWRSSRTTWPSCLRLGPGHWCGSGAANRRRHSGCSDGRGLHLLARLVGYPLRRVRAATAVDLQHRAMPGRDRFVGGLGDRLLGAGCSTRSGGGGGSKILHPAVAETRVAAIGPGSVYSFFSGSPLPVALMTPAAHGSRQTRVPARGGLQVPASRGNPAHRQRALENTRRDRIAEPGSSADGCSRLSAASGSA